MRKFYYEYPLDTHEIKINKIPSSSSPVNSFSKVDQKSNQESHAVICIAHILKDCKYSRS